MAPQKIMSLTLMEHFMMPVHFQKQSGVFFDSLTEHVEAGHIWADFELYNQV